MLQRIRCEHVEVDVGTFALFASDGVVKVKNIGRSGYDRGEVELRAAHLPGKSERITLVSR